MARRVKIMGGMAEFVGKTGMAEREGSFWRVELDHPVEIPGIGIVTDDIWKGYYLKTLRSSSKDHAAI